MFATVQQESNRIGHLPSVSFYLGTVIEDSLPLLIHMRDTTFRNCLIRCKNFDVQSIYKMNQVLNPATTVFSIDAMNTDYFRLADRLAYMTDTQHNRFQHVIFLQNFDLIDKGSSEIQYLFAQAFMKANKNNIKFILLSSHDISTYWDAYIDNIYQEQADGTYAFEEPAWHTGEKRILHFFVPRLA